LNFESRFANKEDEENLKAKISQNNHVKRIIQKQI